MTRLMLRPSWVIDGTGVPPLADHVVVVSDGRVEAVAPATALSARPDDQMLDLTGMTLLPGLINNHVHLVLPGDNTPFVPWIDLQPDAALALWAAHNAETSLRAGVTTVRDCGGRGTTVLEVRDARERGLTRGARIISCGWPLTITGGHTRQFGGEADGEDAVRRMVRHAVSRGADFVKVMASGGGTPGSLSQQPSYTVAELRAIVEAAHMLGRKVSAHCIATASIVNAIDAGVDLIEHASFYGSDSLPHFDPAIAERLAAARIPITPTLQVARDMVDGTPDGPERTLWQRRREAHHGIVRSLRELGTPILAGSDAGWRATAFNTLWKELDELVLCGLSPVAAVRAATGAVSEALGVADRFGTLQPGQAADLVGVAGELASDIRLLEQVQLVMQDGIVVHAVPHRPWADAPM